MINKFLEHLMTIDDELHQHRREAAEFRSVARALKKIRDQAATAGTGGASFSLDPGVIRTFGSLRSAQFDVDRGLVEYAVAFANGQTNRSAVRRWMVSDPSARKYVLDLHGLSFRTKHEEITSVLRLDDIKVGALREELLRFFADTTSDRAGSAQKHFDRLAHQLEGDGVWDRPVLMRTASGADLKKHVILRDNGAFLAYVCMLLLGSLGDDLCQCRSCECYFLTEPNGGPGARHRTHCSLHRDEEERKRTHNSAAPERMRRKRARKVLTAKGVNDATAKRLVGRAAADNPAPMGYRELADLALALNHGERRGK
jgi:hypothetical protein